MKNKIFKTNNDKGIGAVGALLGLTFYVFILSIILSFFLLQIYGSNVIMGVDLPTSKDIKMFSNEQSFINCTADKGTFLKQGFNGVWNYTCGVGMVLISHASNTYLLINNIQKDGAGLYQNSYWINNNAVNILGQHGDYTIVLRYTGGGDQNEIQVKSDGFYIPQYFLTTTIWTGNKFFYPYDGANQVTNPTIKTIYNDKTHTVDFYFNGDKIFITSELNEDKNIINWFGRYYGGVASFTNGFTLEDFQTEGSIISGLSSNIGDTLNMIWDLLITILKISTWSTPSWILPNELVLIFLNLPEAGIVVCAAFIIIRGVD